MRAKERKRDKKCVCVCSCVCVKERERERISERLMYADNETPHEEDEWPKINRHQKNLKKMTFPLKQRTKEEEEEKASLSKSEQK